MGQRVPEDLEAASLEWLCRVLLTSELASAD
jgi:flagellar biosynthesis GTPase FlhF